MAETTLSPPESSTAASAHHQRCAQIWDRAQPVSALQLLLENIRESVGNPHETTDEHVEGPSREPFVALRLSLEAGLVDPGQEVQFWRSTDGAGHLGLCGAETLRGANESRTTVAGDFATAYPRVEGVTAWCGNCVVSDLAIANTLRLHNALLMWATAADLTCKTSSETADAGQRRSARARVLIGLQPEGTTLLPRLLAELELAAGEPHARVDPTETVWVMPSRRVLEALLDPDTAFGTFTAGEDATRLSGSVIEVGPLIPTDAFVPYLPALRVRVTDVALAQWELAPGHYSAETLQLASELIEAGLADNEGTGDDTFYTWAAKRATAAHHCRRD